MKKQKQKMPDGRCATCPRWDRWHIRVPKSEDQQKVLDLYRRSDAASKTDFVRGRLLGETFKVIVEKPSASPYLERLTKIVALTNKIDVLYNEAVKILNAYHSVSTAHRMLDKLETYSQVLIRLQHQAIILTIRIQAKEATK